MPQSAFFSKDIAIYGINLLTVYANFTLSKIYKTYPATQGILFTTSDLNSCIQIEKFPGTFLTLVQTQLSVS